MKKLLFTIFAILFSVAVRSQPSTLIAQIDGWANDTVYVIFKEWRGQTLEVFQEIRAVDGIVKCEFETKNPVEVYIFAKKSALQYYDSERAPKAKSVNTIMFPGSSEQIVGQLTRRGLYYTSSGSLQFFEDAAVEREKMLGFYLLSDNFAVMRKRLNLNEAPKDELDKLSEQYDMSVSKYLDSMYLSYINLNPDKMLSALYLIQLNYEEMIELEPKLSKEFREGLMKPYVDDRLAEAKRYITLINRTKSVVVGSDAIDFNLPDLSEQKRDFTEFKGKWILLYFWHDQAVGQLDEMRQANQKYVGKLEVIGISCRNTKEDCKSAINKHNMNWLNLIELDQSENSVDELYAVIDFPTHVIIDPSGKIVYRSSRGATKLGVTLENLLK